VQITDYSHYLKINEFIYILLQCIVAAHTAYYYNKNHIVTCLRSNSIYRLFMEQALFLHFFYYICLLTNHVDYRSVPILLFITMFTYMYINHWLIYLLNMCQQ